MVINGDTTDLQIDEKSSKFARNVFRGDDRQTRGSINEITSNTRDR